MGTPPPPGTVPGEPQTPWSPPPFGPAALPLTGRWRRLSTGITDALPLTGALTPLHDKAAGTLVVDTGAIAPVTR